MTEQVDDRVAGAARLARWERDVLEPALERMPETSEEFRTVSDVPVDRLYGADPDAPPEYWEKLGLPGEFPFTRGAYPTMYRARPWSRRQVVGLGTARDTNIRHKYVISQGQTGLSTDFDHPTLTGLDSDDPASRGEVGRIGVAIDTVADIQDLFADIPLDKITTSFNINHPAPVILCMYAAAARRRGVPIELLDATIQNDPLKEFFAQKTYVFPPRPAVRMVVDCFEFCARHMPRVKPVSITGYQPRDAGATADQEIAFAVGEGICYIEHALERGLDVDGFAPSISFLFNVHNDFFEEIAKFRAARRVWARVLRDRFGAKKDESCRLRMHVQTGGATLTAQEPLNNIIRGTVQALAAVIGGTQSLAVSCYDEAYSIPSEHAQKMSLRIQEILLHESGVSNTVDPIAGSYYVESLTDELERRAWKWLDDFDERGGMLACVESGYVEQLIADEAYRYQREIETKERIVVGVNEYRDDAEQRTIEIFRVDRAVEDEQIRRLQEVRRRRDAGAVAESCARIEETARTSENLMPAILDAVAADASLGEVIGSLKAVFGEHRPLAIF
jgi:methylmalonyl-CoA mutase N-terminal domain/subunit